MTRDAKKLVRVSIAEAMVGVAIVAVGMGVLQDDLARLASLTSYRPNYHPWVVGLLPMACVLLLGLSRTVFELSRRGECGEFLVGFEVFGVLSMFAYGLFLAISYSYTTDPLARFKPLAWAIFHRAFYYGEYVCVIFPRSSVLGPGDGHGFGGRMAYQCPGCPALSDGNSDAAQKDIPDREERTNNSSLPLLIDKNRQRRQDGNKEVSPTEMMNIALPQLTKGFVRERVSEGGCSSVSESVRALIRSDRKVSAHHDHPRGFRAGDFPGVELQRDRDCRSRLHSLGRAVIWRGHWIRGSGGSG